MKRRFGLLIARQRTGTGALGSVLDMHPQLKYLGEVFHPDNIGLEDNYFTHLMELARADMDVIRPERSIDNMLSFLDSRADTHVLPIIDVKYDSLYHLNTGWQAPLNPPAILQFAREENLPIIHLRRRNLVQVFVSGELADANRVWHLEQGEETSVRSTEIDPAALMRFVGSARAEDHLIERWLSRHEPLADLDYSEVFDRDGNVERNITRGLSETLGVDQFLELKPFYKKQAPGDLRESITNFDAVYRVLAGGQDEWMLGGGS